MARVMVSLLLTIQAQRHMTFTFHVNVQPLLRCSTQVLRTQCYEHLQDSCTKTSDRHIDPLDVGRTCLGHEECFKHLGQPVLFMLALWTAPE